MLLLLLLLILLLLLLLWGVVIVAPPRKVSNFCAGSDIKRKNDIQHTLCVCAAMCVCMGIGKQGGGGGGFAQAGVACLYFHRGQQFIAACRLFASKSN